MRVEELLLPGPPLRPREVAALLSVSVTFVKTLVKAEILMAIKLPSIGPGGPKYGRLRIRREDVLQIAKDLKLLPESPQSPQSAQLKLQNGNSLTDRANGL